MVEREVRQQEPSFDPGGGGFEQKILQSEALASTQLTLREILYKKGADSVGLLDIPFNFQVRDMGNSVLYIASFPENQASFGGEKFIEVLRAAKPFRQGEKERSQDNYGIVGDWTMLLREQQPSSSYETYEALLDRHTIPASPLTRKLREYFIEFKEQGRMKRFWDVLNQDSNKVAMRLRNELKRLVSEEKALARYGLDLWMSASGRFLSAVSFTDQRFALAEFLNKREFSIEGDLDPGYFYHRIVSLFNTLEIGEVNKLIKDFCNDLSGVERRQLTYRSIAEWTDYILVDEKGDTRYVGEWGDPDLSGIKKVDINHIEIRRDESYMTVKFVRDEKTGFREPIVVDEKYLAPEIVPLIIWETDKTTGKRSYFCGNISENMIRALPDLFSQRHDTLLGQIVVAAYSDYLKTKLPIKLPLIKGGREQNMLEAQMPAFVRLFAGAYLRKSPVILGLEASAPKR